MGTSSLPVTNHTSTQSPMAAMLSAHPRTTEDCFYGCGHFSHTEKLHSTFFCSIFRLLSAFGDQSLSINYLAITHKPSGHTIPLVFTTGYDGDDDDDATVLKMVVVVVGRLCTQN